MLWTVRHCVVDGVSLDNPIEYNNCHLNHTTKIVDRPNGNKFHEEILLILDHKTSKLIIEIANYNIRLTPYSIIVRGFCKNKDMKYEYQELECEVTSSNTAEKLEEENKDLAHQIYTRRPYKFVPK